jgi:hypothetical protein
MAQVCRDAMAAMNGTPRWDDLNDRQRRLSLHIVNHILANPDATPEAVHNAWMGEIQHNEGWTTGPIVDETLKQHPNITPFAYLDGRHKASYALSLGIVRALQAIGDRYENCVPPAQAINTIIPSLIHPLSTVTTDGGLTQEEIAQLTPAVPSDAQFQTPESEDLTKLTA